MYKTKMNNILKEAKLQFELIFEVPDFLDFDGEDYMYYGEDPILEEQARNTGAQWRGFSACYKISYSEPKINNNLKDKILDLITSNLKGHYWCDRVWEAWDHGTMTESDFYPAEDGAMVPELVDEILDLIESTKQETKLTQTLKDLYESRGELDKLNCKIMRIPSLLKELEYK